jgi:hypothetical protein
MKRTSSGVAVKAAVQVRYMREARICLCFNALLAKLNFVLCMGYHGMKARHVKRLTEE